LTSTALALLHDLPHDLPARVQRLQPARSEHTGATVFGGWSRMAIEIASFTVIEVARPAVGELKPAAVTAELTFDLAGVRRGDVRGEWDELKEHDVVRALVSLSTFATRACSLHRLMSLQRSLYKLGLLLQRTCLLQAARAA
jgi:intron-binding protein aquarius